MKAFVSVDMEGMPYIVSPEHVSLKKSLYNEARKIMTYVTRVVCEALYENGFEEILVADSHGPMVNLLVEELPEYVELIRGFPRMLSMVSCISQCNAALFLGYHAKYGTAKAVMDHTYSGASIRYVKINGVEVSEMLLNAYVAGHYNIPVIFVAGDEKLIEDDLKKYMPWTEYLVLKRSLGRYAAISKSLKIIESELRSKVKIACDKFKKGEIKPLKTNYPVDLEIRLMNSVYAEIAELIPNIERIDGLTLKYKAKDIIEAYKILELVVILSAGVRSIISSSKEYY